MTSELGSERRRVGSLLGRGLPRQSRSGRDRSRAVSPRRWPSSLVGQVSESIGHATNNVAEYRALIEGLKLAHEHHPDRLTVRADSQLSDSPTGGRYRVKNAALQPLYLEAKRLLAKMPHRLEHVPREENVVADALANAALDRI